MNRNRGEIIINRIDGQLLAEMMISGANNLYNNRKIVDDLNVFPVPDGDTGTNMSMTMTAMAKTLSQQVSHSVSKVADTMSFATLRGARGNSGVILSQFFRGISKRLKGISECTPLEFAQALKEGVDTAYRAVMNPTEGTILTVSREAAVSAVVTANTGSNVLTVLEKMVDRGNKTLEKTQEMLPALKQARVVDAGGQGWMFILEGALFYMQNGEPVKTLDTPNTAAIKPEPSAAEPQKALSAQNIKYMYCTEFIVEKKTPNVNITAFRQAIEAKGDSMLVIDDDDIVKVHIHTNHPGFVLERAVKLGAMINIKIDNMKHQHQSIIHNDAEASEQVLPNKKYAFVAVCVGEGITSILKDLGVDIVIEGGQTMNPSTEDILNSVNKLNADTIFVFPNNKNIILAANQTKEISDKHIIVIPTKSIPECVSAMLAFHEEKEQDTNELKMNKAAETVKTGQVTYAVRDTVSDGTAIKKGDILGINGKAITKTGDSHFTVCQSLIHDMADEDTEFITVYYGEDVSEEQASTLEAAIEKQYPDCEISVRYGGQPLYYYIISVE